MKRLVLAVLLLSISAFAQTNILDNNGTFTGTVTAANVNGVLQVGTAQGQYATLETCYAALVAGQTCEVVPGFTETLTANLVFSLDDAGFDFKGAATITQGSFQVVINPGVTGAFIKGKSTAGGPAASSNAVRFIYTGNVAAWAIGSSVSTSVVRYPRIQNVWIDITGAGNSALGIQAFGFGEARLDGNFIEGKLSANTQICFQIDDAAGGAFSGATFSDGLFINYCQTALQLKGSTVENTFTHNVFLSLSFAGGKGLDLNGIDVASNVFNGGTISGYTTAVSCSSLASHNIITTEIDASTTDVSFAAGTFNNLVMRMDSTGHPTPVISDLGTNNLVMNPAGKLFSGGIDFTSAGFKINATAPSGHVPRGNGATYVDAQLALADLSGILATSKGGTGQNSTATYPTSGTVNTGTGTNNKVAKFTTGANGIVGDSSISDTGSAVSTSSTWEADGISSIGGAPNSVVGLWIQSPTLTGTTEYGVLVQAVCSTSATVACNAIQAQAKIAAGAVTVAQANTVHITDAANGGGGALITKLVGLEIDTLTQGGTTNFAIETGNNPISFGGKVCTYNAIAGVDNCMVSEPGHIDSTGNTAALSATTVCTPSATGRFRISVYEKVTTAASVSSILGGATGTVLTYTDGTDSVAQSITMGLDSQGGTIALTNSGNSTTTSLNGAAYIYAKTGVAIQLAVGYSSTGGTPMAYAMRATCEAL